MNSDPSWPCIDRRRLALLLTLALAPVTTAAAQTPAPVENEWKLMPVERGRPVTTRPFPPASGRNRCVQVNNIAGAQLFGDRAIELTTRAGERYRLFLARECPALSFYQGFYYRRQRAGQLCAGRDVVGARSGGECLIASIIKVRPVGKAAKPKRR
jgi:hypothetical protein